MFSAHVKGEESDKVSAVIIHAYHKAICKLYLTWTDRKPSGVKNCVVEMKQ